MILDRIKELVRTLRAGAEAAVRSEELLRQMARSSEISRLQVTPRYKDPKRLLSSGFKVYSQNDEDGLIAEVFRRLGMTSRRFIEFGVQDGLECNTAFLLIQGWSGTWIEASRTEAEKARVAFKDYPVDIFNECITVDNADDLITRFAGDGDLDLLSIDIDSVDYWIWQAIKSTRPRLVVIEYNATLPPFLCKTVPHSFIGNGSNYFGASLGALEILGRAKGYSLVGCCLAGVNAFFVRNDLVGDHFSAPFTATNHYEPPRYGLAGPSGHRPGIGKWVEVGEA